MKIFNLILAASFVAFAVPAFANEEFVDNDSTYTADYTADEQNEQYDVDQYDDYALRPPHDNPGRGRGPRRPPYPHPPYPHPRSWAWECTAHPWNFPWTVFSGVRSYSYYQAQNTALYNCERTMHLQCVIRSCYQR
jgi:hypothetical protein